MEPFPTIKTGRLLLRQIRENDLEYVTKGLSHPEVIKYYGVSYKNREEAKEQMAWFKKLEETGTGIWWAICSEDNNIFYGAAGLNNLQKEHRKAEIGFWLLPEFRGNGIVRESATEVLKYAFQKLDLHRIEAYVETKNTASARTLEKLDFRHEGRMTNCEINNGEFISLDVYAKLKSS